MRLIGKYPALGYLMNHEKDYTSTAFMGLQYAFIPVPGYLFQKMAQSIQKLIDAEIEKRLSKITNNGGNAKDSVKIYRKYLNKYDLEKLKKLLKIKK